MRQDDIRPDGRRNASLYDDLVMEHIKNARNYRVLDDADRYVGTNPLCGDEVHLYLTLHAERIADLAFQCTCCGISMASASIMTEMLKGTAVQEARRTIENFVALLQDPATQPAATTRVESLAMRDTVRRFPARTRCALLPWTTAVTALEGRDRG
jgi:nitrogen fixation protein NifU and related proteins